MHRNAVRWLGAALVVVCWMHCVESAYQYNVEVLSEETVPVVSFLTGTSAYQQVRHQFQV
jgi:hypothetical protein